MTQVSEVLKAIQDEGKRNKVKALFEDFEQQKMLYAEPLGKLKELVEQRAKYLQEIEDNKLKIQEFKVKNKTEIDALNEDLDNAKDIDDKSEIKRINELIMTKSESQTKLLERNAELEKLANEAEQKAGNTKMALISYFKKKNEIKSELTGLGLDTKFNIDEIDSTSLKKPLPQKPLLPVVEDQREKRKPSWEQNKDKTKQQKTNSELETTDKNVHLIKNNEDKKFVGDWWSKKGYTVTDQSDRLEIKHPISNAEITITDKSASTSSRDDKVLHLMTQQLIEQLHNKGQLGTSNFKGTGPDADKLNRLFKQLKEEKLNQKNEFSMDNTSNQSQNDQNIARARIGMGGNRQ